MTYLFVQENSALAVVVLTCALIIHCEEAVFFRATRFIKLPKDKKIKKKQKKHEQLISMKATKLTEAQR